MSLIIEEKAALDSLANAIIGANGSVDKTSATKGELTDWQTYQDKQHKLLLFIQQLKIN